MTVELGTYNGVSYTALCQAVLREQLETHCFAVDTWTGDAQASESVAAVDACIHLAAIASVGRFDEDWAGCHAVNQSGFMALLQFVARGGRRAGFHWRTRLPPGRAAIRPDFRSAKRLLSGYGADKLGCVSHAGASR